MKTSRFDTRLGESRSRIVSSASVKMLLSMLSIVAASKANAQNITPIPAVRPDPSGAISAERTRAQKIFQALTAVRVPIDDARIVQMEALIRQGNLRAAAAVASKDPLFLDIQIRDTAREMSDRDETVRAPMSDFVATFIGIVRDSDTTSAKEMLTGNFYYRVDPAIIATLPTNATVRQNEATDILTSNNHYADIVTRGLSPQAVLIRQSPQRISQRVNNIETPVDHPDPAGLMTTRAFTGAHAIAGTNRRMVEYSFREFMCLPMAEFADADAPDDRVARDVTRTPSGSVNLYQSSCKACHGQMDGFRGAFAFLDFTNNAQRIGTNVVGKMNRNQTEFPQGYVTTDNSVVNYATLGKNVDQLGWRSALTGNGMASFGKMMADSRAFSRCMVRRAFKRVCRRSPLTQEEQVVRSLADQFEIDGYHMRRMFENVAIQPQCVQ